LSTGVSINKGMFLLGLKTFRGWIEDPNHYQFFFIKSSIISADFDCVICQHTKNLDDKMFGLPILTIALVGGAFLLIILALLYWGLTFKEVPS
jgi:hypothetical protein